ncbi:MAG: hypothetical protein V3W19_05490 [Desulfatiglandales bacterium]
MRVIRDFEIPLTSKDVIDVRLIKKRDTITGFVINLRCNFRDAWHQVYRVDTAHGFLHEQRFWLSPEPKSLPKFDAYPLQRVFEHFMKHVRMNHERYRRLYKEKMCSE